MSPPDERTFKIHNLTAHPVTVFDIDGDGIVTLRPSGDVARLVEIGSPVAPIHTAAADIPCTDVRYTDDVVGLPAAAPRTWYLVSRVLAAAVDRDDLLFPADEVRDTTGRIVGCRSLGRFQCGGRRA